MNINEELDYLIKYYRLDRLKNDTLYELANNWVAERTMYRSLRNMVRGFLIEYYRDNQLEIDNPTLGNGLGRWHIQIVGDVDKNIYCGQKMFWDSSFHENFTVKDLIAPKIDKYTSQGNLYDVCEKCIKSYLRKGKFN